MDVNPYQSPQAEPGPGVTNSDIAPGGRPIAWRDGDLVVLNRRIGQLPFLCVKTGEQLPDQFPFKFRWTEASPGIQAIGIQALVGTFLFQLLSWNQEQTIGVGMSAAFRKTRYTRIWITAGVMVVSAVAGVIKLLLVVERSDIDTLHTSIVLSCMFAFFGCLFLVWFFSQPPLRVQRSSDTFIWLAGADDRFLDRLPAWNLNSEPNQR